MRFRLGDAVLGFHKVWMEQGGDCGVWSTWCVLERKTIYKSEALTNWLCWRFVRHSAASTAGTDPGFGKAMQEAAKEKGSGTCEKGLILHLSMKGLTANGIIEQLP